MPLLGYVMEGGIPFSCIGVDGEGVASRVYGVTQESRVDVYGMSRPTSTRVIQILLSVQILDIACGLAYMHKRGAIHSDLSR